MPDRRDIVGIGIDRAFRVRAETLEDLEIVSSMLQDAIVPISEITFQRRDRRFVLIAQRFRWELAATVTIATPPAHQKNKDDAEDDPAASRLERVNCALRFENVTAVRAHGIDMSARGQMLELLSIHLSDDHLDLAFADNKTIRLAAKPLSCHVEDIGEPWPTSLRPIHPEDDL